MSVPVAAKAVLFDFDGTLGQSLDHWAEAYRDSLSVYGVTVDRETAIEACFNRAIIDITTRFNVSQPHLLRETIWDKVKERMPLVETYPDVASTLRTLSACKFQLGVVSNSRKGHIIPVLERWEMQDIFNAIVTIEDVKKGKPDPEPIHKALELLNVEAHQAWMIGDSVVDIRAGNNAGVKTIAFAPRGNHDFVGIDALRAENPLHIAESYDELLRLINS